MDRNNSKVDFNTPLKPEGTSLETFGFRATNPDNCIHTNTENICAFCRSNCICKNHLVLGKDNMKN